MTQREFYVAITEGTVVTAEMESFAADAIAKLDKANEARKAKASKKAMENAPLLEEIKESILGDDPKTASDVAVVLGCSVQKASALLRSLVVEGSVEVQDIKVSGKGTQKGYTLLTSAEV